MKRVLVPLLLMFPLFFVGCHKPHKGPSGFLGILDAVCTKSFRDFGEGEHIKTKEILFIRVRYKEHNKRKEYQVLFGPHPNSGEEAEGWFHHSDYPTFHVEHGWAYLAGDHPMGEAQEVCASTESTSIILEVVSESGPPPFDRDRVYLLKKDFFHDDYVKAKLVVPSNPPPQEVYATKWQVDRYVETNPDKTALSAPADVDSVPALEAFVDYVKERAVDARVIDARI